MNEEGAEPAVVLTRAARGAKAAIGPTAWAVFEELTLGAERGSDGRLLVTTSVRRLAAELGLDKDTVARALARLGAGGFALRCASERPANASCYVLASISGLTRVGVDLGVGSGSSSGSGFGPAPDASVCPPDGDSPRRPGDGDGASPRRSRRTAGAGAGPDAPVGQLSLLDDDAEPDDATTTTASRTSDPVITATNATNDRTQSTPDTEPEDDHHRSHPTSPIRTTDICHPCGEAAAAPSCRHGGGGAHPC